MEDQTMFLFFLVVSYWGWRKWLKTKSERLLYTLCAITLVGLMNYPLYLPIEFALALWAFFGCVVVSYKIHKKHVDKALLFVPLTLLTFAVIFLMLGFSQAFSLDSVLHCLFGRGSARL